MSDDSSLEEAFRTGLQRRADDADTTVDVLGPARSVARGRTRRRFAVTGAVGLAAAALVTAVVVQNTGGPDGPDGTAILDDTEPLPTRWRLEAWHGLQVEVPADWSWGSAPLETAGEMLRCGGPDEQRPYVGRPVMASDLCMMMKHFEPTQPYVWLGADVEPGTKDVGHGLVQTTVEVEGTTLTVAARSQDLIDHVIDSARPVTGCRASLDEAPTVESMLMEGLADPQSARVCAYASRDGSAVYDLVYATELDAAHATTYHSEVYDGGLRSSPRFCNEGGTVDLSRAPDRVLVTISGRDPMGGDATLTQDTVVDPSCREVSGSPGQVTPFSDRGMESWAVDGLPVTLSSLIGPQG
jgi:hypothetical protein